jgi:hypothetical protein
VVQVAGACVRVCDCMRWVMNLCAWVVMNLCAWVPYLSLL